MYLASMIAFLYQQMFHTSRDTPQVEWISILSPSNIAATYNIIFAPPKQGKFQGMLEHKF